VDVELKTPGVYRVLDVLRMREFGVPRYTLFRDLLHLRPIRSFDHVTDNPQWVRQMRDVYAAASIDWT